MNNRNLRARVFEIVLVVADGQQRIDHRDHCADARGSKPRPDKLRTVRQDEQYAIFDVYAQLAQRVARLV